MCWHNYNQRVSDISQVNDVDALQRGIMDYWGLCETGIMPAALLQRCLNKNINIRDLVLYNLKTYPEVSNDQTAFNMSLKWPKSV